MGGLLFGYDWVVIGGAKPFYEVYFGITDNTVMSGLAMTTALIGCLFGAMTAGAMADNYGRKRLLTLSAVLFTVSAIATGLFNDFWMFNVARFVGGIGIGVASALSPMYIAEIAPTRMRGKLVTLNQMTIVLGILAAQFVNFLLAEEVPHDFTNADILASWNGQMGWRWMFWAETVPAALFLVLSSVIPESPRWQMMKGMKYQAEQNLRLVGGLEYAKEEISNIEKSLKTESKHRHYGLKELFSHRYSKVLLLGLFIAVFQQWCGTNGIFNYAEEVFKSAGFDVNNMFFNIVLTGIVNVVFTFVAIFSVDRLGRRSLMLIGSCGLACIYLVLGFCYHFALPGAVIVALVLSAIACYAMSLAPITWVLLSEIFPNHIRGVAMATCTFALWVGSSTFTFLFPIIHSWLGASGQFWLYALICLGGFIYFRRRCPETKGKSLEQLEKELVNINS